MASGTQNVEKATPLPGETGDVTQDYISGAKSVNSTGGGIAHNRSIAAADTTYLTSTNSATWTLSEGIKNLRIVEISIVAEAFQSDHSGYLIVINAPDDATAAAWLNDDTPLSTQDVLYEAGNSFEPLLISRTAIITRIDVKPLFNDNTRFVIGATP